MKSGLTPVHSVRDSELSFFFSPASPSTFKTCLNHQKYPSQWRSRDNIGKIVVSHHYQRAFTSGFIVVESCVCHGIHVFEIR